MLYQGMVNSTGYVVESWTVRHKGPVFLAMFRPLSILTAVVLGAIFLGDSLNLGRCKKSVKNLKI